MIVLSAAHLVVLAVPKTGSTALEAALHPFADLTFSGTRKHLTALRYKRKVAPFLKDTFNLSPQTVAVMREPLDQLRSWYRYRARAACAEEHSTAHMSFDAFVQSALSESPPAFAKVGSQFSFMSNKRGRLLVDHLFAYEAPEMLHRFLEDRLGSPLQIGQSNVSPDRPAPLSAETESLLRAARRADFALYDTLTAAGGYLGPT